MKQDNPSFARRGFLQHLSALGAGAAAAPWLANLAGLAAATSSRQAAAASTGGYKALVCLYLYGGNDAFNTVLATDNASWSAYLAARNADVDPIALAAPGTKAVKSSPDFNARLGGVLPIRPANAQGRAFALHPSLGTVADLFGQKRVAIAANIGPLVQPTTKTAYLAGQVPLPPKLFSHNDQQSVWQSMGPEGTQIGWGGGIADLLLSANRIPMFTSISLNGAAVWLSGKSVRPYQLGLDGAIHAGGIDGTLFSSATVQQTLVSLMRTTRTNRVIEAEHAAVSARSIDAEATLSGVLPPANVAPWGTPKVPAGHIDPLLVYTAPSTGLITPNLISQQLQAIARMISARSALGSGRQIFFVGVDGFDTHDSQNPRHADCMAQLAQALGYWDSVTRAMGVDGMVTTFSASDFGRAFSSNGDGSDHGWGGHHFVMGGAVKGGDLYGRFPTYGTSDDANGFTSPDQVSDGALLPVASVDQYAATLGKWMGLSPTELLGVLPNLDNFPAAQRDLGFMGA
jgi:uncharacterized protein (DUF1501 family)